MTLIMKYFGLHGATIGNWIVQPGILQETTNNGQGRRI